MLRIIGILIIVKKHTVAMKKSSLLIPFIGIAASFNLVQSDIATALERSEISALAKQYTVLIDGEEKGSGAIIDKDGNTYTVLTNWHVVDTPGEYEIVTPDKKKYKVVYNHIRYLPDIDVAIVKFNSDRDYTVAELGNSDDIVEGNTIHVAAYPDTFPGVPHRIYLFFSTEVNGKLSEAEQGYTLLYAQSGTPGTSGGPLVDENGRIVGINGKASWEVKTGNSFGLGIPLQSYIEEQPNLSPPKGIEPQEDFVSLGKKKAKDGDYQGAIDQYDRAIEQEANNRDAHLKRSSAYFELKDYQSAKEDLERILQSNPKDAYAYLVLGEVFLAQKEYQQALTNLDRALKLDPNLEAIVYSDRGVVYYELQDYQQALTNLDRALELNPDLALAYSNRCAIHRWFQQFEKALADCNEAIAIAPNFALPYSNRGMVYYSLGGDNQKALADTNEAIRLDPNLAEPYFTRSLIYSDRQEYQQALADLNQAIELDPNLHKGYFARSLVYGKLKKYDKALVDANKAIELNPNLFAGYNNRSRVYLKLEEYQKALKDLNKAIELNPSNFEAYHIRSLVYSRLKEYDKALADADKAVSLIPDRPDAFLLLIAIADCHCCIAASVSPCSYLTKPILPIAGVDFSSLVNAC